MGASVPPPWDSLAISSSPSDPPEDSSALATTVAATTAEQEGITREESRTARVDAKALLNELTETTGKIVKTAGNATAVREVTPAVATETATAEDEPGLGTENQDLD